MSLVTDAITIVRITAEGNRQRYEYKMTGLQAETRYAIKGITVNSMSSGEPLIFDVMTRSLLLRMKIRVLFEGALQ